MSTRQRTSRLDAAAGHELPPQRKQRKLVRHDVSLPLANTSLSTVVYFLGAGAFLYLIYYAYLVTQWKSDAGGWINLALGRSSPDGSSSSSSAHHAPKYDPTVPPGSHVENRIKDLAELLGIHPKELASAIKPLISSAKATAIKKDEKTSGTLVDVLTESTESANGAGEAGGIGLGSIVGLDDAPGDVE